MGPRARTREHADAQPNAPPQPSAVVGLPPSLASPASILALQRSAGNTAVGRLARASTDSWFKPGKGPAIELFDQLRANLDGATAGEDWLYIVLRGAKLYV